ncbi:MAG: thioredoxin family protein [Chloroflexia bacterium]|nr:thioredoxin family protein [Chloroflexia bacterium]
MELIKEKDAQAIQEWFEELEQSVRLLVFTQEHECEYCRENRVLAEEMASLSDNVTVEVYDFVDDRAVAEEYGVDKIPAIAIIGEQDYGVRYYGFPGGYEFTTLVEDVIDVSKGDPGLSEQTMEALSKLSQDVHLQVFITPTCPYCPRAVRLAHKLAIASERIRADMVEAIEFPHLSNKYQVFGVPLTIANETIRLEGAMPEARLIQELLRDLEKQAQSDADAAWHG